ncbi:MAG TPA: hypothetical protein VGQ55_12430 [Pyrinomonadaceae bacterium]|jgi:hypothetical protein|nr:hypothetical protein [Pyrinomonadaceae bacterium]
MPVIKTNMYNQGASRAEAAAALDREISKLEDDMRKLKNEFDIYFNGAQKRPPLEARARVDSQIRRISDNRSLSYAQRYQLNSLVAKYSSYRELWRRNMRARGEELI